jgi:hypothetical protein
MALTRAQQLKQLEPGLNEIIDQEYSRYEGEHAVLFDVESSSRAFEEEVLFPGFGDAQVKREGAPISYAETGEGWVARYTHETVALGFAITEEAMEDNLYQKISARLSKALGRSMAHTKQVKAANVFNNAFSTSYLGGDGDPLVSTTHTLQNGTDVSNRLATDADLSESSLETMLIDIAGATDDKGIPAALQGRSLHIPRQLVFIAERILRSPAQSGTANNDLNALSSTGMLPGGIHVNHRFTDTDAWFIRTDCPNGAKMFVRKGLTTKMEGDFETGNVRYKARERYVFGWSDWRGYWGTSGA